MRMMQKTAAAWLALALLTGCGGEPAEPKDPEQTAEQSAFPWLPEGTELHQPETEHLPELAAAIAAAYQIPEEDWDNTRYYYQYTDLNGDGDQEILAVAVGMYTSGSGGESALIVLPYAGMAVKQTFTLVRMPILLCDNRERGAQDLIFLRGGGGGEPELVRLTCTDGVYASTADAEVLESLEGITGSAVLCSDLAADLESGTALTLAGPQE